MSDTENVPDKINENSLSVASTNYSMHLVSLIGPCIFSSLINIYRKAVLEQKKHNSYRYIYQFQLDLKAVPNWSQAIIDEKCEEIDKKAQCLFDPKKIILAIVILQYKIMTSIRVGVPKDLSIKKPDYRKFIHDIYINTSRYIYGSKECLVMIAEYSEWEDSKTKEYIIDIINDIIRKKIIGLVNIKLILEDYLGDIINNSTEHHKYSETESGFKKNAFGKEQTMNRPSEMDSVFKELMSKHNTNVDVGHSGTITDTDAVQTIDYNESEQRNNAMGSIFEELLGKSKPEEPHTDISSYREYTSIDNLPVYDNINNLDSTDSTYSTDIIDSTYSTDNIKESSELSEPSKFGISSTNTEEDLGNNGPTEIYNTESYDDYNILNTDASDNNIENTEEYEETGNTFEGSVNPAPVDFDIQEESSFF